MSGVRKKALKNRRLLGFFLNLIRFLVSGDRIHGVIEALHYSINEKLLERPQLGSNGLTMLDFGCGSMQISTELKKRLPLTTILGVDIMDVKEARLQGLPFSYEEIDSFLSTNENNFDLALIVDVLHHIPEVERHQVIKKIANQCDLIFVKDHFEFGYFSRQRLRVADWFGNFVYGVTIPERYYDHQSWKQFLDTNHLTQIKIVQNVKVHTGLFGLIIPPKYHFLSVIKGKGSD